MWSVAFRAGLARFGIAFQRGGSWASALRNREAGGETRSGRCRGGLSGVRCLAGDHGEGVVVVDAFLIHGLDGEGGDALVGYLPPQDAKPRSATALPRCIDSNPVAAWWRKMN